MKHSMKPSIASSENKQELLAKARLVCEFLSQLNIGRDFSYDRFNKMDFKLDEVRDIFVQVAETIR